MRHAGGVAVTAACLIGIWAVSAVAQVPGDSVPGDPVPGDPPRIRNVYIPSDQLKVLFGNSSQGVLMPREKILALWREARAAEQGLQELPADTILTQASYLARLDVHELRITGQIQFEALQSGWHVSDLSFGGLAIESARVGDQPAQFGRRDDGTLFLLHREPGRFTLDLEMSAPLASKEGDLAVTLKLPAVSASEFTLELQADKQLRMGETLILPDNAEAKRDATATAMATAKSQVRRCAAIPGRGGSDWPVAALDFRSLHGWTPCVAGVCPQPHHGDGRTGGFAVAGRPRLGCLRARSGHFSPRTAGRGGHGGNQGPRIASMEDSRSRRATQPSCN